MLLAAALFGVAVLIWMALMLLRNGRGTTPIALGLLTLSTVLFILYAAKPDPFALVSGLAFAVMPPLVFFDPTLARHATFLASLLVPAGSLAGAVGYFLARLPRWRFASLALGLIAAVIGAFVIGEWRSRALMCQAALGKGINQIHRNTLVWSWFNAPQEFQFGLHAGFQQEGRTWG
ncbi:MAG: hypothetical protein AAF366_05065 [Pseudomonadota bacterium]